MDVTVDTKVIGVVEHEIQKHARIKVIAIKSNKGEIYKLTEAEAVKTFPPKGYVFEPGFFQHHKFQVDEVIVFNVEENERAERDQDRFRINAMKGYGVKTFGVQARVLGGFTHTNSATDLSNIAIDDLSDGEFFGLTDKFIIGRLRLKNGKLESSNSNIIKLWDKKELNILEHRQGIRLEKPPEGSFRVLDCMDDKQLFEWFRTKLKSLNPEYVQLLDTKGKWREEIPKLFNQSDDEHAEVDKVRLNRLDTKVASYRLSIDEIRTLGDTSQEIRKCVIKSVEGLQTEMIDNYQKEKADHESHLEQQVQLIDIRKSELEQIEGKVKDLVQTIQNLQISKERLLNDFSIIKEVLLTKDLRVDNSEGPSYVIEVAIPSDNAPRLSDRRDLIRRVQFQLALLKLNTKYADRLVEVALSFPAFFAKDIRLGLAFAEATGTGRYLIQQVEPDWLHFKDFWNNGLGAIWSSAHANPDTIHTLLLQDINLSSPECYARPLLDCITGIRRRIPFDNTPPPNNLKIIATVAPWDNPKIGLPLIRTTFDGWGAIGYKGSLYEQNGRAVIEDIPGYLTTNDFQKIAAEIRDEDTRDRSNAETNILFDEPQF